MAKFGKKHITFSMVSDVIGKYGYKISGEDETLNISPNKLINGRPYYHYDCSAVDKDGKIYYATIAIGLFDLELYMYTDKDRKKGEFPLLWAIAQSEGDGEQNYKYPIFSEAWIDVMLKEFGDDYAQLLIADSRKKKVQEAGYYKMLKNFTTKEDGDLAEKITKKYMDYYDSLIKKGENFLINSSESESGSGE